MRIIKTIISLKNHSISSIEHQIINIADWKMGNFVSGRAVYITTTGEEYTTDTSVQKDIDSNGNGYLCKNSKIVRADYRECVDDILKSLYSYYKGMVR